MLSLVYRLLVSVSLVLCLGLFFLTPVKADPVLDQDPVAILGSPDNGLWGMLFPNCPPEIWQQNNLRANGFRFLSDERNPQRNLTTRNLLYFEHVMNGCYSDREIQLFSPEYDPCQLEIVNDSKARLVWPSAGSSWGLDCITNFEVHGQYVDLEFQLTPRINKWVNGYLLFMWASYIDKALGREIFFPGVDLTTKKTGWTSFGADLVGDWRPHEYGSIRHLLAKELVFDENQDPEVFWPDFNMKTENARRRFLLPLYYGLVDGDGDLETKDDPMVWAMMFSDPVNTRMTMFNWSSDPRYPAWDWQWVIPSPKVGKTYSHKVRLIYKPWLGEKKGRNDLLRELAQWKLTR